MKRILDFLCIRSFSIVIIGIIFISTSFLNSQPCVVPDNGTGTITLPPIGCDYYPPDDVYEIIDGLPPGTTIELDGPLTNFICGCPLCSLPLPPGVCEGEGGSLGGNFHCFESTLDLTVTGTGELTGFYRSISIPVSCEVHTGPRTPGDPVQTFPSEMYRMQGELFGDPDFCTFVITAGLHYGLPSPGSTTLTDIGGGLYHVDSFFDIVYQIEFVGCPGSVFLDGYGGTTTSFIRIETEGLPAVNDIIYPAPDYWIVPEDPVSFFDFEPGGDVDPLPAGFFGPGSDPFDGVIYFQGESHGSTEFPNPDAIIERTSQANVPAPYPVSDLVDTEIVELSLVSTAPIIVEYDGGMYSDEWDVELELSTYPQPTGIMDITKNDANGGGFYYSPLYVYPNLIFTQVDPPNNSVVWDIGGYSLLDYTNSIAYPWEHSPIGNDFNPSGTTPMELISALGDCELYLTPYLLRQDDFWVNVGPDGMVIAGGGSGYNDGEWYYYPNTDWWNIWFYDHPFDPDREKGINISFTISGSGSAEVVINWSTGYWPSQGSPPLPEDVIDPAYEDSCIVRSVPIFSGPVSGSTVVNQYFEILDYNPEWISIDIRGTNFDISNGIIEHVCLQPDSGGDELDWGDADDPSYPTLSASMGANHIIDGVTFLGVLIDAEPDGQPDPNALGDDINNLADEDGIGFSQIIQGSPAQITVTTSVDDGYLQGWMDFNADGDWADANEQIFNDEYIHFSSTVCLNYLVPVNANVGTTYARFRFSTVGGLPYTGPAPDGEVEDYEVEIIQDSDIKWIQEPCEELPGLHCTDGIAIIADDWQCNGGFVTDIHWWGNYEDNLMGNGINYFHLSIHDNDPTGSCLPLDPEIWGIDVPLALTNETDTGLFNSEGGIIYKYEYILDIPFEQIDSTYYWLDICAYSYAGDLVWRWQESDRSNVPILCPAAERTLPTPPWWQAIDWPTPQPTRFSDMAFVITSEEPEDMDYGDAPDPFWPTLLASDGARHQIEAGFFLGASVDVEPNGQPQAFALGDDNDGNDDEDGVVFTTALIPGQNASVEVTLTDPVGGAFLDAWIDFNINGSFDAAEHICGGASCVLVAGVNTINFNVPAGSLVGPVTFARFRLSRSGGLSPTGLCPDGEVEDYRVFIVNPGNSKMHYPQLPDLTDTGIDVDMYWAPLADDFLCTETGPIGEIVMWGSFADDILPAAGVGSLTFRATIYSNIHAYEVQPWSMPGDTLWTAIIGPDDYTVQQVYDGPEWWYDPVTYWWMPANHNLAFKYKFIFDDPFIQQLDNIYWLEIIDLPRDETRDYTFGWKTSRIDLRWLDDACFNWIFPDPPPQWVPGWNALTYPSTEPIHPYNGTTLDFAFVIKGPPDLDFGDAPDPSYPTLLASDGARHIPDGVTYLGAQIDTEPDGQPHPNALGDDNNNLDDEDGVLFVSPLIPGEQGAIYVNASVSGLLNGWLDFDGNGSWDASEQIFTDNSLIPGWNSLNFSVPTSAVPVITFARFRFDTAGGLGVTGLANDGEVEDYRVVIEENLHDGLKMHYHQWPDTTMFGVDVCTMEWRMVADDFFCVESGPINSIHIWGSWKFDEMMPNNTIFELGIWADNPNGPMGWSEPAIPLWERPFFPGEYLELPYYYVPDGEWWYDPFTGEFMFPGDFTVWEYDFTIPDAEAFFQEEDTVYWLSVRTWTEGYEFGWKSSVNHWNDDAVWLNEPTRQSWQELIYPFPHPFNLSGDEHVSMDMAFYIDCHPSNPVNFTVSKVGTNITLQWDPSWCTSYYNVYSSTDPYAAFPGGWTLEATGITVTTWNDPVSTAGSKKFYRVTAEN